MEELSDPESIVGLVDAVEAVGDNLTLMLTSVFDPQSPVPPEQQRARFSEYRRAATLMFRLKRVLDDLQMAVDKADADEIDFAREAKARGLLADN